MRNPFKPRGDAFHQADEWIAPSIGLIGALSRAQAGGALGNIALIGDIGQGKTAALSWYASEADKRGIVLLRSLQAPSADDALDLILTVFVDVVDRLGAAAMDRALEKLGLDGKSGVKSLRRDQIVRLMEEMVLASSRAGKPVHVIVDECQLPAEAFERRGDSTRGADWFESLKGLADALRAGKGHLVIAITPSPWHAQAPVKLRDRLTDVEARTPVADEIQSFVEEGLRHGEGGPTRAAPDLGGSIVVINEAEASLSVRTLHEALHRAWERARQASAEELTAAHLVEP